MSIYSALIDIGTSRVLAISTVNASIAYLVRTIPNARNVFAVNTAYKDVFPLESSEAADLPNWIWDNRQRMFTREEFGLTDEIRERAKLASAKADVLAKLMFNLSNIRAELSCGVLFQESVYGEKKRQAEALLAGTATPIDTPYVTQYAEIAGLTEEQAAEDIVFASKLFEETLLRTEGLRLKYFKRIREAEDEESLRPIWPAYIAEAYLDSLK